ncbi:MAG TPA: carboxypeptidase-like regulatory domain-containing protein, partial [Blastocatellia bacterium]|nr:carboxypeptidase-like regulatory domain-containing protein [Blastocatellia bacterium]
MTCFSSIAQAQFRAGIQGTVTDVSGAVISGATITIVSIETGREQKTVSSGDGFYRVTGLQPGNYRVIAEREGFKRRVLENVTIGAEATEGVDLA